MEWPGQSADQPETPAARIQRRRRTVEDIRHRARRAMADGAQGVQIASLLSDGMDRFAVGIVEETLAEFPASERQLIERHSAMLAVGGSGRGEVSPYSDADLVFLYEPQIGPLFGRFSQRFVAEFWDAGIQLGQRVHTVREALANAAGDPHLASSLVHIRRLWGSEALEQQLAGRFQQRCVRRRVRDFTEQCLEGRETERSQYGGTATPVEPNVKKSPGCLRDVHLIQWLGFAWYDAATIDSLWRKGALTREDATALTAAVEFLTRIRIDLHLHAGRGEDLLTRDEQLRLAAGRGLSPVEGQSPVELFMQDFFRHVTAVTRIARHFVARHRSRSLSQTLRRVFLSQRINSLFILRPDELDIAGKYLPRVLRSLDDVLRIYHMAASYRVTLSPRLSAAIRQFAAALPPGPSPEAARLFMELLGTLGCMSRLLRDMHDNGVIELVIPEWKRVRCLLQFNQYHHFTVDEHTLRCLEICERFIDEDSPFGEAYRHLKHHELLHLALLLHDAGKGFVEDHCTVGERLAGEVCQRLGLPEWQTAIVRLLILKHLRMADLAFRNDTTEQGLLLRFSHELGTPEKLTMLYLLTIADVSGVGPGVWNAFKGELLTGFYDRLMLILGGQQPRFHEQERLRKVREHVYRQMTPAGADDSTELRAWVDRQLDSFAAHYLTLTPPELIATDLKTIHNLAPGTIHVEGRSAPESGTVDLRIVLDRQHSHGCFHQITGVLAAKRLEILSADITTSTGDIVVDVFRVKDRDFAGDVPASRIAEISDAIRSVLTGGTTVEALFKRHRRFRVEASARDTVLQLPTRVEIDNDTSDRRTVVSVFAHDRPGLLFTIARTLFQMELSIELARIATHFHQVADVFHVTRNGEKLDDDAFRDSVQSRLLNELTAFEVETHRLFDSQGEK